MGSNKLLGGNLITDTDPLQMGMTASEVHAGQVGGEMVTVVAEITRPANTTAYAAKDVIAADAAVAPIALANVARKVGGSGYIVGAKLVTDQSTNVARFRVHFYRTTHVVPADNAAFTLLYANRANRLGSIDIGPLATEGTGSDAATGQNMDARIPFVADGAARQLLAVIEVLDAFTPASGQKLHLEVFVEQN
jgi:hypothetical protein